MTTFAPLLRDHIRPLPVTAYTPADRDSGLVPGLILDESTGSGEALLVRTIRLAASIGMPVAELCPGHQLHRNLKPEHPGGTQACGLTPDAFRLIGLDHEFWDMSHGLSLAVDPDPSATVDRYETLVWAAGIAEEWLNGVGSTDMAAYASARSVDDITATNCYLVRCHPDYATTHSYVVEDNSLYLWPNEEVF